MKQGDIVLVDFPHADSPSGSLHPAVVICETTGSGYADVVLAMASSQIDRCLANDVLVADTDPEFPLTKFHKATCVKTGKIATVTASCVKKRLGVLGPTLLRRFTEALKLQLNLP